MAYDSELAERIRGHLGDREVVEKRMFGGLAFLVGGHMAVAASRSGALMVRCEPAESEALLARPAATRMVMASRELAGWLEVAPEGLTDDAALADWVAIGTAYAAGLPPK